MLMIRQPDPVAAKRMTPGEVASQTQAKKLVPSDVILGAGGTAEGILEDVATTHVGPASVASDLQVFTI
jgi:hypothetical protein